MLRGGEFAADFEAVDRRFMGFCDHSRNRRYAEEAAIGAPLNAMRLAALGHDRSDFRNGHRSSDTMVRFRK
jgi:hypothetical protein